MRLFIAAEPTEPCRDRLRQIQDVLRPLADARWTPPEQLHMTLKFLGETPDATVPELCRVLQNVRIGEPIEWHDTNIVCFPPAGTVRTITAGLQDRIGRWNDLAADIDQACHELDFPLEWRDFRPHVTLGRVKDSARRVDRASLTAAVATLPAGPVDTISGFTLFQSELSDRGAVHVPLARFP